MVLFLSFSVIVAVTALILLWIEKSETKRLVDRLFDTREVIHKQNLTIQNYRGLVGHEMISRFEFQNVVSSTVAMDNDIPANKIASVVSMFWSYVETVGYETFNGNPDGFLDEMVDYEHAPCVVPHIQIALSRMQPAEIDYLVNRLK